MGFMLFTSVHRGGVCGVHVHQCSPWRCLWGSCSPVFTVEVFVGFMFTSVHRGGVCGVHVHQCSPWGVDGVHVVHQCSPWGVDRPPMFRMFRKPIYVLDEKSNKTIM